LFQQERLLNGRDLALSQKIPNSQEGSLSINSVKCTRGINLYAAGTTSWLFGLAEGWCSYSVFRIGSKKDGRVAKMVGRIYQTFGILVS